MTYNDVKCIVACISLGGYIMDFTKSRCETIGVDNRIARGSRAEPCYDRKGALSGGLLVYCVI